MRGRQAAWAPGSSPSPTGNSTSPSRPSPGPATTPTRPPPPTPASTSSTSHRSSTRNAPSPPAAPRTAAATTSTRHRMTRAASPACVPADPYAAAITSTSSSPTGKSTPAPPPAGSPGPSHPAAPTRRDPPSTRHRVDLVGEGGDGRAGAHEVPVAVGLVDAADRRPVLAAAGHACLEHRGRERCLVPLGGVLPLPRDEALGGVRGVLERVVIVVELAGRHAGDLGADRDHRIAEPVELGEVLALGRLHHQSACHRERHGGRVETVVDEPLGDVIHGDAGLRGERPQVQNALVRHQAIAALVQHREVRRQAE